MNEQKVKKTIEDLKGLAQLFKNKESSAVKHCNTAIEALEKQLPKRVDFEEDVTEGMCVQCPSCGNFLGYQGDCLDENYQLDYCQHCGQKLDWTE